MHVVAGPPVDLSRPRDADVSTETLREATDRIMAAITGLVEQLRDEPAPRDHDPSGRAQGGPRAPGAGRPRRRDSPDAAAVMGGGSWGTAFAMVLADAGNEVVLWAREPQVAASVARDHENPAYHPGITLPDAIDATADPAAALAGAELVVLAVPSQTLRANLAGVVDRCCRRTPCWCR